MKQALVDRARYNARMPTDLLFQLDPVYEQTTVAVPVMNGRANWPGNNFGRSVDVSAIVVHFTEGWPRRDVVTDYIGRYTNSSHGKYGIGPQFHIAGDGTVFRTIDLPLQTGHARGVNGRTLGVETGNLGRVAAPPGSTLWTRAEQTSPGTEDFPGMNLYIAGTSVQNEVDPAWWTTANYTGPGAGAIGAGMMLFSEAQYRSWALLLRYLFEEYTVPRHFLLLPTEKRSQNINAADAFRVLVLADERADMMIRAVAAPPLNFTPSSFDAANFATLQTEYTAAKRTIHVAATPTKPAYNFVRNDAWKTFFEIYKGVHGHVNVGDPIKGKDHDCPTEVFDFHRLSRETWDWWWYPFDANATTTAVARRPYRKFNATTRLYEYYYDESAALRIDRIVESSGIPTMGIHGETSSPETFTLDAASPIYACANGELVAARFPTPGTGVSLAFVLVRHRVYHRPHWANSVATELGSTHRFLARSTTMRLATSSTRCICTLVVRRE